MNTESRNPRTNHLDQLSGLEIVQLMDAEEAIVFKVVAEAAPQFAIVAQKVAETYLAGGRIVYVGAGTSGRISAADAAEMPPTFGVDADRFVAVVAGGNEAASRAVEHVEDDEYMAISALNELEIDRRDILIGLTASGKTPFVVAAVRHARAKGIWTCGIANSTGAALLEVADMGILLDTGPEVLTGSTRLKAGTAQKMALNRISTAAMILAGKVVENLMVEVKATNHKLQERCVRIVRDLTTLTEEEARQALERAEWSVRSVLAIHRPELAGAPRSILR